MIIFRNLKALFIDFLYNYGIGKKGESAPAPAQIWEKPQNWWGVADGETSQTSSGDLVLEEVGKLDAPTLLLNEGNQAVLIIEHDFRDIPSWVEWDRKDRTLSLALMGGGLLELPLSPEALENALIDRIRRLLLVTGNTTEKISHFVAIITRD